MSATTTPTTKLEAVNSLLATIGERPVNTLSDTDRLDVVRAVNTLEETSKATQLKSWWFNLEENIDMAVTVDGEVLIPTTALKITESARHTSNKWVARGDDGIIKLYDMDERSFTSFTGKQVKLDITFCLDFNDLPEAAKMAIFRRAGVTYQMRTLGSRILEAFTEREAVQGWGLLLEAETEALNLTIELSPGVVEAVVRR